MNNNRMHKPSKLHKFGEKYVWPILAALGYGGSNTYWFLVAMLIFTALLIKFAKDVLH